MFLGFLKYKERKGIILVASLNIHVNELLFAKKSGFLHKYFSKSFPIVRNTSFEGDIRMAASEWNSSQSLNADY